MSRRTIKGQPDHKRGKESYRFRTLPGVRLMKYGALNGVAREVMVPRPRAEPIQDRRRKGCAHEGCPNVHLRGSDYCLAHDTGDPPRTRRSD